MNAFGWLGVILVAWTACTPALAGVKPGDGVREDVAGLAPGSAGTPEPLTTPLPTPTPTPGAAKTANVDVPYDFEILLYQGKGELGAQEIRFSDAFAQGKPVVLILWAGLCPTCRLELPQLQKAYAKYGPQVLFLGVDIGPFTGLGVEADGRALLSELFVTFPAGGTAESAIMREYRVLGVPETLLFSAEGELVDRFTALVNQDRLDRKIQALLDL